MTEATAQLGGVDLCDAIARGGNGVVWRGVHVSSGTDVAVKILSSEVVRHSEDHRRFRREIRAHAGLSHDRIASVYGYGQVGSEAAERLGETFNPDAPYFIMEWAPGGSLREGLVLAGWSPLRAIVFQLLDALAYAHARGVIHRDIKPGNILGFPSEGLSVKLADFGLAHAAADRRMTGQRELSRPVGTVQYMAPEQLRGDWREFGPWTDLYGLGCVIYELVTGRPVFGGGERQDVVFSHLEEPVPAIDPLFPVPDGFGAWLRRLLQKRPPDRFRRASEAALALADLSAEVSGANGKYAWVDEHDEMSGGESGAAQRTREIAPEDARTGDALEMTGVSRESLEESTRVEDATPDVDSGDNDLDGTSVCERRVPPLPEDWRRSVRRRAPTVEHRIGMSLFGLRELPLVGREAERDAIWSALHETLERGEPRVVLLEGDVGLEKNQLASWMKRRVNETGACAVLSTSFGNSADSERGLSDLLQQLFCAWQLSGGELRRHIRRYIERWHIEPVPGELLESEARAISAMIRPSEHVVSKDGREASPYESPRERYEKAVRLFGELARQRPVLLQMDDIDLAPQAVDLLIHLLETADRHGFPVLAVGTVSAVGRFDDAKLERLMEYDAVERIELEPLGERSHRAFVQSFLPLEGASLDEVVERTQGRPLFAAELIRDWVERGVLEQGDDGFRLVDRGSRRVPENLRELFDERVERAIEALDADDRDEARRALELAAVLGEPVNRREWQLAARYADLAGSERVFELLAELGLLELKREEWHFYHPMLIEALVGRAREEGRFGTWSAASASALRELYPVKAVEPARRRALHLENAEDFEEASEALDAGITTAQNLGDITAMRQLLEQKTRLLDRRGIGREHRERIETRLVESRVLFDAGEVEEGRQAIALGCEVAGREGWHDLLADALVLRAFLNREEGGMDAALEDLERARELYETVGDPAGAAECDHKQGIILERLGKYDEAEDRYRKAARAYDDIGKIFDAINAGRWIVYPYIYRGELEEARRLAKSFLGRAKRFGSRWVEAGCLNQLGEISRFQGAWDDARTYYESFIELSQQMGRLGDKIAYLNLALVDIGDERFDGLEERLDSLEAHFRKSGQKYVLPTVHLAQLTACLGSGSWEKWRDHYEKVVDAFDAVDNRERDTVWLAERAVAFAARSDKPEVVEALDELGQRFGIH